MEVKPVCIDAKNYSAMRRPRLFWTNTPNKRRLVTSDFQQNSSQENMTLQEHLTPNLCRVAVVDKIRTVTTNRNSLTKSMYDIVNTEGSFLVNKVPNQHKVNKFKFILLISFSLLFLELVELILFIFL